MPDFLKKKFNFAKGGVITGESLRVEVENNEWIVPMKNMKRLVMYAIIANSKSFRFRFRNLVAVTHCKDCEWYQLRTTGEYDCRKTRALMQPKPDDFCSFAERKDNG